MMNGYIEQQWNKKEQNSFHFRMFTEDLVLKLRKSALASYMKRRKSI